LDIYNVFIIFRTPLPLYGIGREGVLPWEWIMPIFEYRCGGCGHKFEAILLGGQTAECPKCHAGKLEQQLSTFSVSTGGKSSAASEGCGQSNCCMTNGGCSVN
jgi:putative FmdB family regulatory protein